MHFVTTAVLASLTLQAPDTVPHAHPGAQDAPMPAMAGHRMLSVDLGGGWRLAGMAQVFPIATFGLAEPGTPLDDRGVYLTQGAAMLNLESPGRRIVLRVTPNFEAATQGDGELTPGGWGEGFIDARHPHTVVHEAMISVNGWDTGLGDLSLSGGKGFAPYGTDDPMARPSVKYPTNHHLSQVLERFTLNAAWARGPWSLEAGLFGGAEPEDPWDFSNVESFGDSWSVRATRRFGAVRMGQAAWEVSGSFARVADAHGEAGHDHGHDDGHDHDPAHDDAGHDGTTDLFNGAVRLQRPVGADGELYGLVEYSWSEPTGADGYRSFLAEASWRTGPHTPYVRYEHATRPEYVRDGVGGDAFFRYDHDAEPVGATRWAITSVGYGFTATRGFVSIRPFVEGQFFTVAGERGGVSAAEILGDTRFAAVTVGARVYVGGDPMRMGTYGIFDPMTRMGR